MWSCIDTKYDELTERRNVMTTLYIFGNGFDIAHGIETPYSAFRKFLSKRHESFLTRFEAMYNIQPLDDSEPWYTADAQERWNKNVVKDLWEEFEKVIGQPNIDEMYDFAQTLAEQMPEYGIADTLDDYWKREYAFSSDLQKYVLEWLQTIETSHCSCRKRSLVGDNEDYFINFNYTDILERIYKIKNVLHIHGGIPTCSEKPPLMGHGNKFLIDDNKNKAKKYREEGVEWAYSGHKAISRFVESLYKDTESIIDENEHFFDALAEVERIVCLGISFGDVDVPYLERILQEAKHQVEWIVYYYSDNDRKRLEDVFGILGITRRYQVLFKHSDTFWD